MSTRKRDEELRREIHIERRHTRGYRERQTSSKKIDDRVDEEEADIQAKLGEFQRNISMLTNETDEALRGVNSLGDKVTALPSRLSGIRNSGYKSLVYLDEAQKHLYDRWVEGESRIRDDVSRRADELRDRLDRLNREVSRARYSMGFNPGSIEYSIDGVRSDLRDLRNHVEGLLQKYRNTYNGIDKDLRIAEQTIEILASSSFDWKKGEHPILAVEAEDLENDAEGFVVLTNHRFIFEKEEEVALKKTWFIVTEKKKVRSVVVDRPIGSLDDIKGGRVGLLKGAGVYVKFRGDSDDEIKFDTSGKDAEKLIRFYKFIVSGEADKELDMLTDTEEEADETPITCSYCGAPYTDEVYRGQTTLKCKYCSSVIQLQT